MKIVPPLLLISCLCCFARADNDDKLTSVSYPSKVGTEWTYAEGKRFQTLKLTAVTQKNEEQVLEICEKREAKWVAYEKLLQSKAGLFRIEKIGSKIEPPIRVITNPFRMGDKWDRQITDKAKAVWIVDKSELITVPAGRFYCISIKSQISYGDGSSSSCTCWYADKVGLVKMAGDDDITLELKTFSLGKD